MRQRVEATGGKERDGGGSEALRGEKKLGEAGGRQKREEGLRSGLLGRGVGEGVEEGEEVALASAHGRKVAGRGGVHETIAAHALVLAER